MTSLVGAARTRAGRLARPAIHRLLAHAARDVTDASRLRRAIVFAPHPDDEVLGCGATIAAKRSAGTRVEIVFVTDGEGSRHPRGRSRREIAALRRAEALMACTELGVEVPDTAFLGLPDGHVADTTAELARHVADVLERSAPDEVLVPYRRDPHVDHRAAGATVSRIAQEMGIPVLEYPVWLWAALPLGARAADTHTLSQLLVTSLVKVDATGHLDRKRRALAAYASRDGIAGGTSSGGWFQPHELYLAG